MRVYVYIYEYVRKYYVGKGSVLALLRARGWANELSAGEFIDGSDFAFFRVKATCTEKGMEHVEDIVRVVFAYVGLMRGAGASFRKWVWEESRDIAASKFRFKAKNNPINYTTALASNMQLYSPEHSISGPHLLRTYDDSTILRFQDMLSPSTMRVFTIDKKNEGRAVQSEEIYGTKYLEEALPATYVEELERIASLASSKEGVQTREVSLPVLSLSLSVCLSAYPSSLLTLPFLFVLFCESSHLI